VNILKKIVLKEYQIKLLPYFRENIVTLQKPPSTPFWQQRLNHLGMFKNVFNMAQSEEIDRKILKGLIGEEEFLKLYSEGN
jgi:hypothetical protein